MYVGSSLSFVDDGRLPIKTTVWYLSDTDKCDNK